jgi:mono/diheme cytochrome c family protein
MSLFTQVSDRTKSSDFFRWVTRRLTTGTVTWKVNVLIGVSAVLLVLSGTGILDAQFRATDPGVRGGPAGAGGPIGGLTTREFEFFAAGQDEFEEVEEVSEGLGPRMNLNSCQGCHRQPATGGTSPLVNPQVAFATADGGTDRVPFFITLNGPVLEARFKFKPDGTRDGGVHNTATITGRSGADGCNLAQPDFGTAGNPNLIFRIPSPVFGAGLIEQVPDSEILRNQADKADIKSQLGIHGVPNRNGNDGTISRFGWKAQNQSLLLFSGEAYNVEMGITNSLFQSEREQQDSGCQTARVPNDITDPAVTTTPAGLGAIEKFAFFQRFLAPPTPAQNTPSINNGRALFTSTGCALCHTATLMTGNNAAVRALNNRDVNLFSDLLLHRMGSGLADNILQGQALGDQFRTAPLWGLGKRIFFLHDGRKSNLLDAIQAHRSSGSEANAVIVNFNGLTEMSKQDLLNFLRSL